MVVVERSSIKWGNDYCAHVCMFWFVCVHSMPYECFGHCMDRGQASCFHICFFASVIAGACSQSVCLAWTLILVYAMIARVHADADVHV